MHVSWSPTARCSSAAATELSTPPESASSTLPLPILRRQSSTASSKYDAIVHSGAKPQILYRKFFRMSVP